MALHATTIRFGDRAYTALAAQGNRADAAATLYGRAEELHNARVRFHSERLQFARITERHIETLRARQPLRWTLGVERGRSMKYDALIDLALAACDTDADTCTSGY